MPENDYIGGLLSDTQIQKLAENGMITPYANRMVRETWDDPNHKILSFGQGSYGYDLRLSPKDFRLFSHRPGSIVDPKKFDTKFLETADLHTDTETGDQFFIIPGNSYALGVTIELLCIPTDVTVLFIGKSTYARCGIIANLTPAEAGWRGYLTVEFSNSSAADASIYANEGCVQALFLQGKPCSTSYEDRSGKYQNQTAEVTTARV
jgi:dCTP deaminase